MSLPVKGQGIIVFKNRGKYPSFSILSQVNRLNIKFTNKHIVVTLDETLLHDPNNNSGIMDAENAYYWFSIDSQNQILYAGIGEPRIETVKYRYQFLQTPDSVRKQNKALLESLSYVDSSSIQIMRIIRDPIRDSIPLQVRDMDELTMDDIASSLYLPKSNLNAISQKMYECIAGPKFVLDDDFPDFSKAIEYSITTEGCWCNTTLKKKSTEFGKPNPLETYLRITLGKNNGESPGVPYVMEIWPPHHFSPVHSHANANAVIRVLHGEIHVNLYPFLSKDILPFGSGDFKKDEITWISPTLNQIHQLVNLKEETCITIQCYMYNEENKKHYDYFDYLDEDGHEQQYEPDADMDFVAFKKTMKMEWDSR